MQQNIAAEKCISPTDLNCIKWFPTSGIWIIKKKKKKPKILSLQKTKQHKMFPRAVENHSLLETILINSMENAPLQEYPKHFSNLISLTKSGITKCTMTPTSWRKNNTKWQILQKKIKRQTRKALFPSSMALLSELLKTQITSLQINGNFLPHYKCLVNQMQFSHLLLSKLLLWTSAIHHLIITS